MNIIPNRYFEMTLRLLYRVQTQTSDYVRGQSLDSLANAVLISGALWILGVPYSLVIGCFAGLANAIPLVGPLVGGLAAVLLCLLGATTTPWWLVAGVLFAIHMFDNLFIYPRTVGGSLDLPAWIVILGIAVGGQLAGVLGMLVAVPTIGLLRGFILELYASLKGYRIL
jgi:predicted PurR-regulated permease PerM